jgi:hypothetical protein
MQSVVVVSVYAQRENHGAWDRCGEATLGLSVADEAVGPAQHTALAPLRETLNSRHPRSPAQAPREPWKGGEDAQWCGEAVERHDPVRGPSPSRTPSRFLRPSCWETPDALQTGKSQPQLLSRSRCLHPPGVSLLLVQLVKEQQRSTLHASKHRAREPAALPSAHLCTPSVVRDTLHLFSPHRL